MTTAEIYRARRAERERVRTEDWPQNPTIKNAIDRGFWPDAYGNPDNPDVVPPPAKFFYPAAGVAHPNHANGVAAGADLVIFTHSKASSIDDVKDRPVWAWGAHDMQGPLWGELGPFLKRWKEEHRVDVLFPGFTLEEALTCAEQIASEIRSKYIIPTYCPETRKPTLLVHEWLEIANLDLRPEEDRSAPEQLSIFDTEPKDRSPFDVLQEQIKAEVAGLQDLATHELNATGMYVQDLLNHANRIRRKKLEEGQP